MNGLRLAGAIAAVTTVVATASLPGCGNGDGPLTLYGTVDIREVPLAFRQTGRVASVLVEEGDRIEPGGQVATLDDEPFREQVAAAEARVAVARAQVARLEQGPRPQEIEQARAAVAEAQARVAAAAEELGRKTHLVDSGASSEREVTLAREQHETTKARLSTAKEQLDLAEEGTREEDIAAGRAELQLAEAQLEQARTALADTRLTAPSPGVVLTRVREPGAIVAAGAPIAVLSLRDPVVIRAYVSEPHLGDVAPGTRVRVTTDSSDRVYEGRVGFVSPRAEFTPKNVETPDLRTDLVYRLRIIVDDADDGLLQGMPVTARVTAGAES